MSVASFPLLLLSALVFFVGIYLREVVRMAQQQKIMVTRVEAFHELVCSHIASVTHHRGMMDRFRAIDGNIVILLDNFREKSNHGNVSQQDIQILSVALKNLTHMLATFPEAENHPLLPIVIMFNNRWANMSSSEYKGIFESFRIPLQRYISDTAMVTVKDGAIINKDTAISISQLRELYISIIDECMGMARTAHYHENAAELSLETVTSLIDVLFKCVKFLDHASKLLPAMKALKQKSTFQLAIRNLFL